MDTYLLARDNAESVSEISNWANSLVGHEVPGAPEYRVIKVIQFQFHPCNPSGYDALILVEVIPQFPAEEAIMIKEADIEEIEEITATVDERTA